MTTTRHILAAAAIAIATIGSAHAATLLERYTALRAEKPQLRARDAARYLGVSEAELVAAGAQGAVVRLNEANHGPREIMRRALDLGQVMALTRNDNCVIEVTGTAMRLKPRQDTAELKADPEREARQLNIAGGYLGGPIDLRFQFPQWKYVFAVTQPGREGAVNRSLQFFDANGVAVHKLYVRSEAGVPVFEKLIADFRHPRQDGQLDVAPATPKVAEKPDSAIDVKEFQQAWRDMSDVHQFNRIVSEFGLTREQAMRLGPDGVVQKLDPTSVRGLLQGAAKNGVAIMAFVGNGGVTQIYSGKINKVADAEGWLNVLDPTFNLHLNDDALRSGYLVRRAGVTSVEFYDTSGELVVTFFGVRQPGKPQPQEWLDLAASLKKA
ncbi:hemin-degrading factor [Massilia sp. G4R7]|uniref:Hemin-degrading factor n=1 Tax=Massilia phyllostachyos TaxID=2898585 RepID=A0ABS8QA69_9BURK|nr:ChuX/HutX family heme-like substrate-binding protein [Massilia phyllostachyos]MCD2518653.1 hemin-degrading factor [Massilia phyllostachyos]